MSENAGQPLPVEPDTLGKDAAAAENISELKSAIAKEKQRIEIARIEIKGRLAVRLCLERTASKLLSKRLKSREVT